MIVLATCHCGAVRIAAPRAPEEVLDCRCSICRRLGALWSYWRPSEMTIEAPADADGTYLWGERSIVFHHCRHCGCTTHWTPVDPSIERMAINSRLLEPHVLAQARVRVSAGPT
jgi:hypothetical protein